MTSQHDKPKRWQFSIMHLLAVIGIAGVLFAVLRLSVWLGLIWFAVTGSAYGFRFTWQRNRYGATESIVGGVAGGIAGLLAVLIFEYTSPEPWEDSGLGFFGCLVAFFPFAVLVGTIIGILTWFAGTALRAIMYRSGTAGGSQRSA